MEFEKLKDGQRVNVYIPAMKRFYKMKVTKTVNGTFTISNYGSRKNNLIDGHEFLGEIKNQEDLDNFFYMQKEPVTGLNGDKSFSRADAQFKKNKRGWIYN